MEWQCQSNLKILLLKGGDKMEGQDGRFGSLGSYMLPTDTT